MDVMLGGMEAGGGFIAVRSVSIVNGWGRERRRKAHILLSDFFGDDGSFKDTGELFLEVDSSFGRRWEVGGLGDRYIHCVLVLLSDEESVGIAVFVDDVIDSFGES